MPFFLLLVLVFSLTSCARLKYMEQGLALRDFALGRDEIAAHVAGQDRKFELLRQMACQNGSFEKFPDKASFAGTFGEPLLKLRGAGADGSGERWLYRYALGYSGSPRVYVLFDARGFLREAACIRTRDVVAAEE